MAHSIRYLLAEIIHLLVQTTSLFRCQLNLFGPEAISVNLDKLFRINVDLGGLSGHFNYVDELLDLVFLVSICWSGGTYLNIIEDAANTWSHIQFIYLSHVNNTIWSVWDFVGTLQINRVILQHLLMFLSAISCIHWLAMTQLGLRLHPENFHLLLEVLLIKRGFGGLLHPLDFWFRPLQRLFLWFLNGFDGRCPSTTSDRLIQVIFAHTFLVFVVFCPQNGLLRLGLTVILADFRIQMHINWPLLLPLFRTKLPLEAFLLPMSLPPVTANIAQRLYEFLALPLPHLLIWRLAFGFRFWILRSFRSFLLWLWESGLFLWRCQHSLMGLWLGLAGLWHGLLILLLELVGDGDVWKREVVGRHGVDVLSIFKSHYHWSFAGDRNWFLLISTVARTESTTGWVASFTTLIGLKPILAPRLLPLQPLLLNLFYGDSSGYGGLGFAAVAGLPVVGSGSWKVCVHWGRVRVLGGILIEVIWSNIGFQVRFILLLNLVSWLPHLYFYLQLIISANSLVSVILNWWFVLRRWFILRDLLCVLHFRLCFQIFLSVGRSDYFKFVDIGWSCDAVE